MGATDTPSDTKKMENVPSSQLGFELPEQETGGLATTFSGNHTAGHESQPGLPPPLTGGEKADC